MGPPVISGFINHYNPHENYSYIYHKATFFRQLNAIDWGPHPVGHPLSIASQWPRLEAKIDLSGLKTSASYPNSSMVYFMKNNMENNMDDNWGVPQNGWFMMIDHGKPYQNG